MITTGPGEIKEVAREAKAEKEEEALVAERGGAAAALMAEVAVATRGSIAKEIWVETARGVRSSSRTDRATSTTLLLKELRPQLVVKEMETGGSEDLLLLLRLLGLAKAIGLIDPKGPLESREKVERVVLIDLLVSSALQESLGNEGSLEKKTKIRPAQIPSSPVALRSLRRMRSSSRYPCTSFSKERVSELLWPFKCLSRSNGSKSRISRYGVGAFLVSNLGKGNDNRRRVFGNGYQ